MRHVAALLLGWSVALWCGGAKAEQPADTNAQNIIKPCAYNDVTSIFVLRQDFTDLPLIGCQAKDQLPTALGANVFYQHDNIHQASSLGVTGLAALDLRYAPSDTSVIENLSFGPYIQGSDMRTLATGAIPASSAGSGSAGAYVQAYLQPLQSVVRIHGGEATDSTSVRDGTAVGEFIPQFYLQSVLPSFLVLPERVLLAGAQKESVTGLYYIFAPEVEIQYDAHQGGPRTYALFGSNQEAIRIGPLLSLKIYGFDQIFSNAQGPIKSLLQQTAMSFAYHVDWDVLSDRKYYDFQPALIVNIVPSGNLAVTTSYAMGDAEGSGNRMRQVKVALAAKF